MSTHHLCFRSKIIKIGTPCTPQFYYIKVGYKGVYITREDCAMNTPLNPTHLEKLGIAGVYLFFLVLLQNIDCGYSLNPPRLGGST